MSIYPRKMLMPSLITMLLFTLSLQALGQEQNSKQKAQSDSNTKTFELKEFSVFEEKQSENTYYLRSGQYVMIEKNKSNPNVQAYPKFKSSKPIYGSVTFGGSPMDSFSSQCPRQEFFFVVDESKGTGKGYDQFYFDSNRDLDLSNDQPLNGAPKPAANDQMEGYPAEFKPPVEVEFEAFTVALSTGQEGSAQKMKLAPSLTIYDDMFIQAVFTSATAHKGKIKIGSKEHEVYLCQGQNIKGGFADPNTGLHFFGAGDGPDMGMASLLGAIKKIDGMFYRFSASHDGSQLFVHPYDGEYGELQVASDTIKHPTVDGFLSNKQDLISLKDCKVEGDNLKVPTGEYNLMMLRLASNNLSANFYQTSMMRGPEPGTKTSEPTFNIKIAEGEPYVLDMNESLSVVFDSPDKKAQLKPGEQLMVSAMLHLPAQKLMLLGVEDRSIEKERFKIAGNKDYIVYASIDPQVKITDSSGKVVAQGKMPFG